MKFNIGDIVRGKKNNGYGITNHEAYMQIQTFFHRMMIEINIYAKLSH